jgi:hypothetical protein
MCGKKPVSRFLGKARPIRNTSGFASPFLNLPKNKQKLSPSVGENVASCVVSDQSKPASNNRN